MDLEKLTLLILGWLFGLLSPVVVDAIRKRRRFSEVLRAFRTELEGFRFVIAATALRLAVDLGAVDRSLLELILPAAAASGPYEKELPMASAVEKALAATDEEIGATVLAAAPPGRGTSLKKHSLPFVSSQLDSLPGFEPDARRELLEVLFQVRLFNEVVEDVREYTRLTFSVPPGATHEIVETNLQASRRNALGRCRMLLRLLNSFLTRKSVVD